MPLQQHLEDDEIKFIRRFLKTPDRVNLVEVTKLVGKILVNHEVLMDKFVDENDTVWTRPTPEAYAKCCKMRDKNLERAKLAEEKLMNFLKMEARTLPNFTPEQMQAAFKMVQNPEDWKLPVDLVIDYPGEDNLRCMEMAITHYTGSIATIVNIDDNKIRVYAAGYYATIGS